MKKIVQWIYCVCTILFGIVALFEIATESGIMFIISGVLICPIITNIIPKFKLKKFIMILISLILVFVGLAFFPEEDTKATEQEQHETSSSTQSVKLSTKFSKWMNECIDENVYQDYEDWREYPEKEIFPVWKEIVLDKVSGISDVEEASDYISDAATVYLYIYEKSSIMKEIKDAVIDVTSCYGDNNKIKIQHDGIDFETARKNYITNDFYITQRLETEYSDSILGDLQKAYDDYTSDGSYWIGYDVDNSFGIPSPGENYYVFRSTELNPFSKSDVYNLMFYDTGTTHKTKNQQGFVYEAPVYQIINNPDKFTDDIYKYESNLSRPNGLYQRLLFIIEKEKYSDMNRSSESIDTYELSGAYISQNKTPYSLSMFSAPEGLDVGNLEFGDLLYSVYCVDTNRYLAVNKNESFIICFTIENKQPTMHVYENGNLLESIIISEHYYS